MIWEIFKIYRETFAERDELGNEVLTEQLYESVKGRRVPIKISDFPMEKREAVSRYIKVAIKGPYDIQTTDLIEVDGDKLEIKEVIKCERYTTVLAKRIESI